MNEVTQFHHLSHIFISLIGALLSITLYFNIRKKYAVLLEEDSQKRVDKGLLYISLAFLVWVMAGIWTLVSAKWQIASPLINSTLASVFSLLNSILFVGALFYMPNASDLIYHNKKNIQKIIFGFIAITIVMILANAFISNAELAFNYLAIPDILMSLFVSVLLIIVFHKTFVQRGMPTVALISTAVISLLFLSQYPVIFSSYSSEFYTQLTKIISKTSFIFICLVLAASWVIELANTPRNREMKLEFLDWSLIKLNIPSKGIINETIDFGSKTTQFKNLLKFAIRRKYGSGDEQAILVGGNGELKSQTYLTRILDNLKEILPLDDQIELDRKDLFTFLGEGKYRLRLLPEHIIIEDNLLHEFSKQADNQDYNALCNKM